MCIVFKALCCVFMILLTIFTLSFNSAKGSFTFLQGAVSCIACYVNLYKIYNSGCSKENKQPF